MTTPQRISVEDAHDRLKTSDAILVCAYDDAKKCEKYALEGSTPWPELKRRQGTLSKERELIFYCA